MPVLRFDEKLLQDYNNKIYRHIETIQQFTKFLESKGYPGSSQFNQFIVYLQQQMKKSLVDEVFIGKMQEIDNQINQMMQMQQFNKNP